MESTNSAGTIKQKHMTSKNMDSTTTTICINQFNFLNVSFGIITSAVNFCFAHTRYLGAVKTPNSDFSITKRVISFNLKLWLPVEVALTRVNLPLIHYKQHTKRVCTCIVNDTRTSIHIYSVFRSDMY